MTRNRMVVAAFGSLLVVLAGLLLYRSVGRAAYEGPVRSVSLDLTRPDALVRTRSLSSLPRGLLQVPLFRDLLTEDFVFYYEEHPDRLGLKGSLRRIAYEHRLEWNDELIAWVLDRPAEVALWRGGDGTLRYWLVSVTRGELAKVLQEAATVTLKDRYLTLAGPVTVEGKPVDFFAFEYSPRRTLLLGAYGDRVVILSEPGMLLGEDRMPRPEAEKAIAGLLSPDPQRQALFRDAFRLEAEAPEHSVVVRTHYLSFGYQRFFPGVEALRFDFGGGGWATRVLWGGEHLEATALRDQALWGALPARAAACALLPVDWRTGQALLDRALEGAGRKPVALAEELEGPAAVCWYPGSRLQAPLFAATLKAPREDLAPLFEAVFDWSVGPAPAKSGKGTPGAGGGRWQRTLQVPFVGVDSEGRPVPGPLTVTLACRGRHLYFSPDAARVEQALATLEKRYPSLADTLPGPVVTLGILSPKGLAEMGREEALVMLPRGAEPGFRSAAERLLLPRLDAMGKYPSYRLALAQGSVPGQGWQAVEWQELRP